MREYENIYTPFPVKEKFIFCEGDIGTKPNMCLFFFFPLWFSVVTTVAKPHHSTYANTNGLKSAYFRNKILPLVTGSG